jgi:hypothetical protein
MFVNFISWEYEIGERGNFVFSILLAWQVYVTWEELKRATFGLLE